MSPSDGLTSPSTPVTQPPLTPVSASHTKRPASATATGHASCPRAMCKPPADKQNAVAASPGACQLVTLLTAYFLHCIMVVVSRYTHTHVHTPSGSGSPVSKKKSIATQRWPNPAHFPIYALNKDRVTPSIPALHRRQTRVACPRVPPRLTLQTPVRHSSGLDNAHTSDQPLFVSTDLVETSDLLLFSIDQAHTSDQP